MNGIGFSYEAEKPLYKMTPFTGVIFCKRIYENYFLLPLSLLLAARKTSVLKSFFPMSEIFISRRVT